MAKFADVLTIVNGRNQSKVENPNGQYPIYGSGGIMGYADDYLCEAGTVVIGRKGSINKPIYVDTPFWNVDTAFGLAAKRDVLLPKYLYYFCVHFDFEKLNTTVTIPSLTKANLLEIDIALPTLEEQYAIVEQLDKVEALIFLRKQQIAKLDELVKARFVEMFGDEDNPCVSLIDLIVAGAGLSYGIVVPGENVADGVPMIRPSDFRNDALFLENLYRVARNIESKFAKTRLNGTEVLVQVIGQPGQIMLTDSRCRGMNVTRNLAVVRPDSTKVDRLYLKAYMETPSAQSFMLGETKQSTLKQLPLNRLKELPVPLPLLDLQHQFAAFVAQTDQQKLTIQHSLAKLELLKKALMQKYFG